MINVNFGAAGVTEFNSADFFLQTLIGKLDIEFSKTAIRIASDDKNYIELGGQFVKAETKNPLDFVTELNSYSIVIDGKMNYSISGLEIDHDTLISMNKLAKYLDKTDYKINGSDANNSLTSGSGDDILNGGKGNDWLIGNAGDDILIGGAGSDNFVFHEGDGIDTIKDFVENGKLADTIDLSDFGAKLSYKDLDISREGKHDVSIDFGKGNDEIILQDVNIKQITAGDFDF
jgi:Ca2+-binding RTX toxin-like protein